MKPDYTPTTYITQKNELYRTEIENLYGYCAYGNLPLWKDKENYIGAMTPEEYLSRPTSMACRDLCLENPTPQGTRRHVVVVIVHQVRGICHNGFF